MSTQPEQLLENNLIKQLVGLDYSYASIHDEEDLLSNLKTQLEAFNQTAFSDKEFGAILNHLSKSNVFAKARTLRDRFQMDRDSGDSFYVRFFDSEEWSSLSVFLF